MDLGYGGPCGFIKILHPPELVVWIVVVWIDLKEGSPRMGASPQTPWLCGTGVPLRRLPAIRLTVWMVDESFVELTFIQLTFVLEWGQAPKPPGFVALARHYAVRQAEPSDKQFVWGMKILLSWLLLNKKLLN